MPERDGIHAGQKKINKNQEERRCKALQSLI